jgi:hypothetical protein
LIQAASTRVFSSFTDGGNPGIPASLACRDAHVFSNLQPLFGHGAATEQDARTKTFLDL